MTKTAGLRRLVTVAALVAATAILVGDFHTWLVEVSPVRARGSDFSVSYIAAVLVRHGSGSELYVQFREELQHATILSPSLMGAPFRLPFITPPTTALLAVPFTALDPEPAYRLFSLLQVVFLADACFLAATAAPWPRNITPLERVVVALVAVAGSATLVLLLLGQWDGLCALGLAAGYASWRRGNRGWAGFWIALGVGFAKPHLALGLGGFLLGRRYGRELLGAVAGGGVVVAASFLVVGPSLVAGFRDAIAYSTLVTPPQSTLGFTGMVSSWVGTGAGAGVIAAGGSGLVIAAAIWIGHLSRSDHDGQRLEPHFAIAVGLSLLAPAHVLAHDFVLAAPAFVALFGWGASRDSAAGRWPGKHCVAILAGWLVLNVAVGQDAGNGASANVGAGVPGRIAPAVLIAVIAMLWAAASQLRRHEAATTAA